MKTVKIILIAVEIAAIYGVIFLAFNEEAEISMGHFFHATYITLLSLLAVVMQKEQQDIDWEGESENQYCK